MARPKSTPTDSSANLGFEAKLWLSADKLRNNMDAAEPSGARQPARQGSPKGQRGGAEQYKHVVLGLIFLKYISDTFDEHHAKLVAGQGDFAGANPEDTDEYLAANVFWGAGGCPLGAAPIPRQAPQHRQGRGRRDGRART